MSAVVWAFISHKLVLMVDFLFLSQMKYEKKSQSCLKNVQNRQKKEKGELTNQHGM